MASAADASSSSPFLVDTTSADTDISEFDKTKNALTSVAVNWLFVGSACEKNGDANPSSFVVSCVVWTEDAVIS